VAGRELVERGQQQLPAITVDHQAVGAWPGRGQVRDVPGHDRPRRSRAPLVAGQVARDPQQVCRVRQPPVLEVRQRAQRTDEYFPGQVLSLGRIGREPGEGPVHGPPAAPAQRIQRVPVAGPGQPQQG
jgi:hypothetical protein